MKRTNYYITFMFIFAAVVPSISSLWGAGEKNSSLPKCASLKKDSFGYFIHHLIEEIKQIITEKKDDQPKVLAALSEKIVKSFDINQLASYCLGKKTKKEMEKSHDFEAFKDALTKYMLRIYATEQKQKQFLNYELISLKENADEVKTIFKSKENDGKIDIEWKKMPSNTIKLNDIVLEKISQKITIRDQIKSLKEQCTTDGILDVQALINHVAEGNR
jgi:hypothetical protein